jgi:hypothetical protein
MFNAVLLQQGPVDKIRSHRNNLIKDFLDDRFLKDYLLKRFNIREVSFDKVELARRELKDLLISPVNIVHYRNLVSTLEDDPTFAIDEDANPIFLEEIEPIIRKTLL